MSLEVLKHELSELDVEMSEILDDAKKNNDGQLSDDARHRYDDLDVLYDEKLNFFNATKNDLQRKDKLNQGIAGRQTQDDPISGFPKNWGNNGGNHLANRAGSGTLQLQTGGLASLSGHRLAIHSVMTN